MIKERRKNLPIRAARIRGPVAPETERDVVVDINDFKRVRSTPQSYSYDRFIPKTRIGKPRFLGTPQISFLILLVACGFIFHLLSSRTKEEKLVAPSGLGAAVVSRALLPSLPAVSRGEVVQGPRSGETTANALRRLKLDPSVLDQAASALSTLSIPLEEVLTKPQQIRIGLTPEGGIGDLRFPLKSGDDLLLTVHRRGVDARLVQPVTAYSDKVVMGSIRRSFAADAVQAGMSAELIDDFVDLFSDRIEFSRDLHPGDRFTIIFGNTSEPQKNLGVKGTILAAAVESEGRNYIAIRYVGFDGKPRYFDEKGELIGNTFLRYPLKFSRISSYFSDARLHPILQRRRPHLGVDFAAPTGTPIRSVASGRVIFAGNKGPNGNMVEIRHNDRYTTTYLHLSRIAAGISKGRAVGKGDVIGAVGCTGLCTGPHLHFGFFDRGKYTDPLKLKLPTETLLKPGLAINRSFLERAIFTIEHYQKLTPTSFS